MWCIQLALRSMGLNTVFVRNLKEASSLRFKDLVAVVTTPRNIAIRGTDAPLGFTCKLITLPDGFWQAPNPGLPTDDWAETPSFGNHFLYTSGTTGEYKKVMSDSRLERLHAERAVKLGRGSADTVAHVLGFGAHTVIGYRVPVTAWFTGATIIIDERPDALANLLRHSPTEFTLTPDLASALAARPPKLDPERPLPTILLGGGFISHQVVQTLQRAGFTDLRNAFGATECSRILYSAIDSEDSLVWLETYPDRHVEVIDEDGRICDYGQEGKIRIKLLDHDATGYFDDPEATAAAFSDGWFYPGDLAIRRHDNRIRILGRAGDVINLLGVKQATAPFEQAVQQITHASAVCIFQEVRLDGTDELVVVLEAEDSPSSETLDRIRSLFPQQTALRVEVLPAFPRTTLGMSKIKRLQLRKMVFG